MSSSQDNSERVIFAQPKISAYQEAFTGIHGPPAESTRMPVQRDLVPSLRLTTDYADNYRPLPLPRRRRFDLENHQEPPIDDDVCDVNRDLRNHESFRKQASDVADYSTPTDYRDNYVTHDPHRMVELRGRSIYKWAKSSVIPETPLAPISSETTRAFIHFPCAKPEHYISYPDEGASRYPKHRRTILTVSPEEAQQLTAKNYSPKYEKNLSSGLFHGLPDPTQTAYQSCSSSYFTWPRHPEPVDCCKPIRAFVKPTHAMSGDTTHRDHFSGKSIKERFVVGSSKFSPLEKSEATDEKVAAFESSIRQDFWNAAETELRKHQSSLATDENFSEIAGSLAKYQPVIQQHLRPMQMASDRIQKGHVVGMGGSNATNVPFCGETTYHEELRWEKGGSLIPAKPHNAVLMKLMKQYPDAPTGLSDYRDNYQTYPRQSRPEIIQKRY